MMFQTLTCRVEGLTWEIWGPGGWFCGGAGSSCRPRCPWTSRPGGRGWFCVRLSTPRTAGLEHSTPSGCSNKEPGCTLPCRRRRADEKMIAGWSRYRVDVVSLRTWTWWCLGAWACEGVWSRFLWCPALSWRPRPRRGTCRGRRPPAPRSPPTAGPRSPQKESPSTLDADQHGNKEQISNSCGHWNKVCEVGGLRDTR